MHMYAYVCMLFACAGIDVCDIEATYVNIVHIDTCNFACASKVVRKVNTCVYIYTACMYVCMYMYGLHVHTYVK
jgi:hypothetical protein